MIVVSGVKEKRVGSFVSTSVFAVVIVAEMPVLTSILLVSDCPESITFDEVTVEVTSNVPVVLKIILPAVILAPVSVVV